MKRQWNRRVLAGCTGALGTPARDYRQLSSALRALGMYQTRA